MGVSSVNMGILEVDYSVHTPPLACLSVHPEYPLNNTFVS